MQDCEFCNPCPRLLLKLIKTICGYQSLTRKPGWQRGLGQPESPVPAVGTRPAPSPRGSRQAAGGRRGGHSSCWSRTRSDSGFCLSLKLFFFLSCFFHSGSPLGPLHRARCCEYNRAARWGGRVEGDERGKVKLKHVWKGILM